MRYYKPLLSLPLGLALFACGTNMDDLRSGGGQEVHRNSSNAENSNEEKAGGKVENVNEDAIHLVKELDLGTVNFSVASQTGTEISLSDYMNTEELRSALVVFCKEDNAVCRMITRDLGKDPIGAGHDKFAVIGVLIEEAKVPAELPDFMKFDDHLNGFLSQLIMETPDKDVLPYFAMIFNGRTKQGIMTRTSIEKVTHVELKNQIETLLNEMEK